MTNFRLKTLLFVLSLVSLTAISKSQTITQNRDSVSIGLNSNEKSIYERIWAVPQLYENDRNKVIQEFSLIGRYHGQFWRVSDDPEKESGWENRRIFLGAEAKLFKEFTLHLQIKISGGSEPLL